MNHSISQTEQTGTIRPDDVVLTGDRPTGPLHVGHLAGSLLTRVALQGQCAQFLLIADLQALTDHARDPARVAGAVTEVVADYLAVGIDPHQTTIVLQSELPELAELTMLYLDLVTVARLERNPTVRSEILTRGFARDIPAGFLTYPVSQAADITGFRGTLVPVGADQLPMIEQSNEIVRAVNRLADTVVLPESRALLSATPRLPGLDGSAKMSKSSGNTIPLSATPAEIRAAVRSMFTDPQHVRAEDPGHTKGNVVFAYLDAFDPDRTGFDDLARRYRRGGVGDAETKRRLETVLVDFLEPIAQRRAELARDRDALFELVLEGSGRARPRVAETLDDVRRVFGLRTHSRNAKRYGVSGTSVPSR